MHNWVGGESRAAVLQFGQFRAEDAMQAVVQRPRRDGGATTIRAAETAAVFYPTSWRDVEPLAGRRVA